jgi:threonine dehydrogenase-like Zn-dependent dehydrogenase
VLAITVAPGHPRSERLAELPPPDQGDGELLVEMIALGICGTDREIVEGSYGWSPPGKDTLILGHESLGRVRVAPAAGEVSAGDLVVGVVRRPDPKPCPCCARGEYDMCRNGGYRERGIKELDGYGAQLVALEPAFAVKLDPGLGLAGVLAEPTSVVAKAWEQIERVSGQACRPLATALVTGAGPIGLLAALLGAQRGLQLHVLDKVREGPKQSLVQALGATYHTGSVTDACRDVEPDIVLECTGVPELVVQAVADTAPGAVVCLLGVSPRGRTLSVDVGSLNDELVLENDVVMGSVNANHRHFAAAADALAAADPGWLEGLITRRVPLGQWREALDKRPTDIKTIIEFSEARELS